jgi:two-component sensor histidine kinase
MSRIRQIVFIAFFLVSSISSGQGLKDYDLLKSTTEEWLGKNVDSAFHYASQMLAESKRLNNFPFQSEALLFQGLSYGYMNEFDKEAYYYAQSYAFAKMHSDTMGIAKALLNLGVNKFYIGMLDSAAMYYERGLRLFEAIDNNKYIAMSLNNLGQVYSRLDKYEEASTAYKNSLKYKIERKDTVAIVNTYFNLASLSIAQQDYEEGLRFSEETLKMAQALKDSVDIGEAYINMTLSLTNLERIDEAAYFLEQALAYRPAFKNEKTMLDLHSSAADLYMKQQVYTAARFHLVEMRKYLRMDAFSKTQMKYYQLSYEIEKIEGNAVKALGFLEKYQEIKDNYMSESVQNSVADLEKKYQTEQKELQITQLELESQKNALKLVESQNQRNLFISGFLIILSVAGFTYYRYRNKKKTSDLLSNKNLQITVALEERETLLKEIHHRVKNNLQVISSLLSLQAGSLDNEAAVEAVREGQHRVRSMALIHQKLYSADDVRGVDLQDYFENLVHELKQAYGAHEIDSQVNTSGLKLDIDTVIPLGLIMNELITNALKYAFEHTKKAKLELTMIEEEETLRVILKDNGVGMDQSTIEKSNAFGWKMIRSLSRKVKADIQVTNDKGTTITLLLARYKLVS